MWSFATIEPIFTLLIASYLVVLIVALVLIKKDMKKPLSDLFRLHSLRLILVGFGFAVLFQAVWFGVSLGLGGKLEFFSFPSLSGFEVYAYYSLPIAFSLYLAFAVFGAFAEEVAYRGYVQTRISSKYGYVVGIFVSTMFFSLQHIHIFQLNWITSFLEGQFIYVIFFGIFTGYLFVKSGGSIWTVFAFHGLMNAFNVSLPVQVTTGFIYTDWLRIIISFSLLILILRFLPLVRMKKRFGERLKERIAEQRGWQWALTSFAVEAWSKTKKTNNQTKTSYKHSSNPTILLTQQIFANKLLGVDRQYNSQQSIG